MPPPMFGKPRVIQGSFLGGAPKLSPAMTIQPSTGCASPRPMAPHVQAAAARHVHGAPAAQRFPGPPAVSAPPARAGHAIALPPAFQLSPERPGQPLPPDLRQQMEGLLNANFSAVRIHVGSQAAQLGARALTMGSEIYFAPGQYSPGTSHGRRLLAHELTHVVQQSSGRVRNPFGQGIAVVHDPGLEAEAERISLRVASATGPGTVLSLCPSPAQPRRPAAVVQMGKRTGNTESQKKTTVKGKITKPPRTKPNTPRPQRIWNVSKKVTVEGATRHSGSGYLRQGTKLKPRKKRNYKKSRTEQVLGEVSTLLYFALKDGDESVTEVEAMMAGGSLFLACNARSETQALYEFLVLKSKKERWNALTSGYGTGKVLKATNRMATKVHMLRSGQRNYEKAKEVIEALENQEVGWIDLEGDEPDFYAGLALEVPGFTWVVFGQDKRHAEVKLVKVLEAADYKGAAVVQGKKRPCYTCAAYMRLRKQEGYSLVFSDFPGKLWQDEFNRSEGDVQQEVIKSLEKEVPSHKTEYGEEWRSDSESEDDDLPKRPVRVKKRIRKKKTTPTKKN